MAKKESSAIRPDTLGASVKLTVAAKVDAALAELAWLEARIKINEGLIEAEKAKIDERFKPRAALAIGQKKTTISDRAEYLRELIEAWAAENLEEHCPKDSRTLKLSNGSISAREQPPAIENVDEATDADVLHAMNEVLNFVDECHKLLALPFGDDGLTIGDFVRLVPTPNRARLQELLKSERVADDDLSPFKLKAREAFDKYQIKLRTA